MDIKHLTPDGNWNIHYQLCKQKHQLSSHHQHESPAKISAWHYPDRLRAVRDGSYLDIQAGAGSACPKQHPHLEEVLQSQLCLGMSSPDKEKHKAKSSTNSCSKYFKQQLHFISCSHFLMLVSAQTCPALLIPLPPCPGQQDFTGVPVTST